MCVLLAGLPNVTIRGVGHWPSWLRIEIAPRAPTLECAARREITVNAKYSWLISRRSGVLNAMLVEDEAAVAMLDAVA